MVASLIRVSLLTVAVLGATTAQPATAQTADARIDAIEKQMQALQEELRRVRRDVAARDAQLRAAQVDATRARQAAATAQPSRPTIPSTTPQVAPVRTAQSQPGHTQTGQTQTGQTQTPGSNIGAERNGTAQAQAGQASSPLGTFKVGGVTVQLGGFLELAGIYRSRNEVADISSNFNTGIPFGNSALNHEGEFRATARQSRVSLLATGNIDDAQKLAGYFEVDFQGGAPTANSNESNSYNPRLRQAYATYDNTDWGVHVLGGQAWSLITMNQTGITPRQENIPLTIDAQYVPGFVWTRQPQLRIAKDFADHRFWLAASLENPQTSYSIGANGTGIGNGGTANTTNPGIGILATGGSFSTEIAPDIILKAAYDPGFGHYEVYGLGRFPTDRVSTLGRGTNNTTFAGGVGGGMILPIVRNVLSFELRGLAGYGIGRYGSSQLPDATVGPDGSPKPLGEIIAMAGLVGHPAPAVDLYGYVGTERESKKAFTVAGKGYGYGSPLYSNAGCGTELSTATCTANTSGIVQGTVGGWWRFLRGNYGTAEVGAQYSYTKRETFKGVGGAPSTDENIMMMSFRYLPFQ